ncbi:hypothetical protein [uncultured Methanospirillum sp.]|uniref:hypothetical protein n=1 Tax=uncultured Methanospirillum sp. TaxID=262503 RepID=UPI0029C990FA|nr:hypothetical protein [uncultured Methanospirillum sp.]
MPPENFKRIGQILIISRSASLFLLLLAIFCIILPVFAAPTVDDFIITSQVDPFTKVPGPQKDTFSTSDKAVYAWIDLNSVTGPHDVSFVWYRPGDILYKSVPITGSNPIGHTISPCILFAEINIAKNPPTRFPGTWNVDVQFDGQSLINKTFTIEDSGTSQSNDTESIGQDDLNLANLATKYMNEQKTLGAAIKAQKWDEALSLVNGYKKDIDVDIARLQKFNVSKDREEAKTKLKTALGSSKLFYSTASSTLSERDSMSDIKFNLNLLQSTASNADGAWAAFNSAVNN